MSNSINNSINTTTTINTEATMNINTTETSERTLTTVMYNMASTIVKEELASPKQALALSVVFTENLDRLMGSGNNWEAKMTASMEEVTIDGELVESFDFITVLRKAKYVYNFNGSLIAGEELMRIIDTDRTSYAPLDADVGVIDRKRNYARIKTSPLFKEAIHALESTKFMRSEVILDLAVKAFHNKINFQLESQQYVLDGTLAMERGKAYVSEFFGDTRGRMYQACCAGVNGQSSDLARALMDLHGVSTDYDVAATKQLLLEELKDMGNWSDDNAFRTDYLEAVNDPLAFITKNVAKKYNVNKPWNFIKFSLLIQQLGQYESGKITEKPYIGVAVGLDAKCSGPQLGGLMVADENILASCGFSSTKIDDAYHNAIVRCEAEGITGLTRSLVKKSFMAIFYGASKGAMTDPMTITQATYDALYDGLEYDAIEEKAELFHKAIQKSFGMKLNNLRRKFKEAGVLYEDQSQTAKYDKVLSHSMPDGLEVKMDYRHSVSIDGTRITQHDKATDATLVETTDTTKSFYSLAFKTKEVDYVAYARNGFVNLIQGTDALIARLIVVHLNRLGASHIVSIHDCFRVNIHDIAILDQAIKNAYMDLFGSEKNEASVDMPLGTDIIGLYFKGSEEATAEVFKAEAPKGSQFYGKDQYRRLDEIKGHSVVSLIQDLGNTYYFAK